MNIVIPQRGDRRKLIETAAANAREETLNIEAREKRTLASLQWLKERLGLPEIPERIESYDISNISGSDNVASMVVFRNGRPLKKEYRKFKIKTVVGQDDYASMRETLDRRFTRMAEGDEKFSAVPQLLLIDGGLGHVGAAYTVLSSLGLDIPAYGMVKDNRHRTRALISGDGEEIGIESRQDVFSLIGSIQEETHRFAIEYHRSLRSARLKKSELDGISGIGEKRKTELLRVFGSVKNIKEAQLQDLERVVKKAAARAVYDHFHGGEA